MPKNPRKTVKNVHKHDPAVPIVVDITGVSPRYVRMIRDGERKNEAIFCAYMDVKEGIAELIQRVTPEYLNDLNRNA
jgi:hypothetical protein